MRLEPIADGGAWRGADLAQDASWIVEFTDLHRAEALCALREANSRAVPIEEIGPDNFVLPTLGPILDGVIDEIEGGRGVSLLRGAPISDLTLPDIERLFWGLASYIGFAERQDISGRRLHHVRAEKTFSSTAEAAGAFAGSAIRGYQTNIELTFHGDGSDALFFLCRRAAKWGGKSRIASATAAFNEILARDASLAAGLQTPFAFDARGQLGPDRPFQLAPIFSWHEGRMSILYKRGYIDLAQLIPDAPRLTRDQIAAMDALDAILNDPSFYHEFLLRPGDIQIANNYSVLHARTAFTDHDDPDFSRHMLRIWSTLRRKRRPLPPAFAQSREFGESYRRRALLGDGAAGLSTVSERR
jgi:hypothetical protein